MAKSLNLIVWKGDERPAARVAKNDEIRRAVSFPNGPEKPCWLLWGENGRHWRFPRYPRLAYNQRRHSNQSDRFPGSPAPGLPDCAAFAVAGVIAHRPERSETLVNYSPISAKVGHSCVQVRSKLCHPERRAMERSEGAQGRSRGPQKSRCWISGVGRTPAMLIVEMLIQAFSPKAWRESSRQQLRTEYSRGPSNRCARSG